MSDNVYKWLKIIGTIILPATATLVITIFKIWNIPNGEMIAATISAVAAFIASILQISSYSYARVEKFKREYKGIAENKEEEVVNE